MSLTDPVPLDVIALIRAVYRAGYTDGYYDADPECGDALVWASELSDYDAEQMAQRFRLVGAVVYQRC